MDLHVVLHLSIMAGLPSWHVGRHARRKTFLFMKADAQGRQGDRHKKLGTSFKMKPNIHPEYRPVAFVDLSINKTFIIPSAVQTRETVEIDGVTYPLFKLDTSSASHPFYTGAQTRIVEAGRVEKFRAKFAAKKQGLNTAAEAAKTAK